MQTSIISTTMVVVYLT